MVRGIILARPSSYRGRNYYPVHANLEHVLQRHDRSTRRTTFHPGRHTESYGAGNGPFTGLPNTATYDPATGIFSGQQAMAHGRWYPTATVLGYGRVMVLSGAISGTDHHNQNLTGSTNTTVELYTVGSGWSSEYPVPAS